MRLQPLFPARRWIRLTVLAKLILIVSVGLGKAQEPSAPIFSVARTAVQKKQLRKSEQIGFSIIKTAYSDIPAQGGVLIGFDLQFGKVLDHEIVHAIKPVYATEAGDITTKEFGAFFSTPGKKTNADLTRSVRICAPQGFAVGSITVRHGLYINGLKLTFHRIKGNALDTNDAALSNWLGSSRAGHSEKTVGGNGAPIVGIFGNKGDRRVLALGVYQLPAALVPVPPPVFEPRDDPPVIANRNTGPEEHAVAPEKKPADRAPMEPVGRIENPIIANPEPKAAPKAQGQDHPAWLLFGIVGCVSVVMFIGCWLAFGAKLGDRSTTKSQRVAKKLPRTTPPPLPKDADDVDADRPGNCRATPSPLPPDLAEAPVTIGVNSTAVMVKPSHPVPSGAFSEKPAGPAVTPSPAPGVPPDSQADVPSIAGTQPPYFHARAVYSFKPNRFFRVYVLPEMLLFLDAGAETNDQFRRGVGAAGAVTGGLLGAVVGHAIGSLIDSTRDDVQAARKKLLDTSNTGELIQLAGEGGASFRVAPADLQAARIEPTSTWHTLQYLGNQYVGLLCFHHPDQGDMTLEIPAPDDMRTALAELPSVFGDRLVVNVVLDRRSWRYVGKSS